MCCLVNFDDGATSFCPRSSEKLITVTMEVSFLINVLRLSECHWLLKFRKKKKKKKLILHVFVAKLSMLRSSLLSADCNSIFLPRFSHENLPNLYFLNRFPSMFYSHCPLSACTHFFTDTCYLFTHFWQMHTHTRTSVLHMQDSIFGFSLSRYLTPKKKKKKKKWLSIKSFKTSFFRGSQYRYILASNQALPARDTSHATCCY